MSYDRTAMNEYPVVVEDGVEQTTDKTLTFYRREREQGVTSPPNDAAAQTEEWVLNFLYGTRIKREKQAAGEIDNVLSGLETGYIVPLPMALGLSRYHVDESAPDWLIQPRYSFFGDDTAIERLRVPTETEREYPTFRVSSRWAPVTDDDMSLLMIDPTLTRNTPIEIAPSLIDISTQPQWVRVVTTPKNAEIKVDKGFPLIQVIPIPHDYLSTEAEVKTDVNDEQVRYEAN